MEFYQIFYGILKILVILDVVRQTRYFVGLGSDGRDEPMYQQTLRVRPSPPQLLGLCLHYVK